MGRDFRPPRRNDTRGWKAAEALYMAGVGFAVGWPDEHAHDAAREFAAAHRHAYTLEEKEAAASRAEDVFITHRLRDYWNFETAEIRFGRVMRLMQWHGSRPTVAGNVRRFIERWNKRKRDRLAVVVDAAHRAHFALPPRIEGEALEARFNEKRNPSLAGRRRKRAARK